MKLQFIVAALATTTSCSDKGSQDLSDQTALIAQVEASVSLPEGASAIESFSRSYTSDQGMIVGIYLRPELAGQESGSRWVASREEMPMILDGGCAMVTVLYDPDAKQFVEVYCNGVA